MKYKEALTKKVSIVFLFLFLITSVSAFTLDKPIPSNYTLNCGESLTDQFKITPATDEEIIITPGTISSGGFRIGLTYHPDTKYLHLSFFQDSTTCSSGTKSFWFKINGERYDLNLEVSEDLWLLDSILLSEGKRVDIGGVADFGLVTVDDDRIRYIFKGCANDYDDFLDIGQSIEETCDGEKVKIELESAFGDPFSFAKVKIYSSEAGFNLVVSNDSIEEDSSGCELGLSNENTIIRRGKLLTFTTINIINGKPIPNIVVKIIDPGGEVADYSAKSDYIGFFKHKISEEFKEDHLIVQLVDMDGDCDPKPLGRYDFEKSYDDYKKAKGEEEGKYQLVLNFTETRFVINTIISNTIKNTLGTGIDSVEVKITKPDGSSYNVNTDTSGIFSFIPDILGLWKVQGGKENYQSTDLREIEVYSNKEYLIVIEVDGKPKSTYKKNDRITFKLVDINNTIIPLNIDATFAGLPLKFISGISDAVTFEDTCALIIPATEGYIEQQLQLNAKVSNWTTWLWRILIGIGVIVIIFIFILIIRKFKGSKSPEQQMEIQLGEAGGE